MRKAKWRPRFPRIQWVGNWLPMAGSMRPWRDPESDFQPLGKLEPQRARNLAASSRTCRVLRDARPSEGLRFRQGDLRSSLSYGRQTKPQLAWKAAGCR